jgi:hypothetical protein
VIAVATGPQDLDVLSAAQPDLLLHDLSDHLDLMYCHASRCPVEPTAIVTIRISLQLSPAMRIRQHLR